jgi:hypothetical protein
MEKDVQSHLHHNQPSSTQINILRLIHASGRRLSSGKTSSVNLSSLVKNTKTKEILLYDPFISVLSPLLGFRLIALV